MKFKLLAIIILIGGISVGIYYYYQYNFVKTLMLSEIVGHTDNPIVNIIVNISDFDTGLTLNDIKNIKNKKDYWIGRLKEVESLEDSEVKTEENLKLFSDMMEDPTMKKVCKSIHGRGLDFLNAFLESQ